MTAKGLKIFELKSAILDARMSGNFELAKKLKKELEAL